MLGLASSWPLASITPLLGFFLPCFNNLKHFFLLFEVRKARGMGTLKCV